MSDEERENQEQGEGDEPVGGPTQPAELGDEQETSGGGGGGASDEGSEHTHDDTPVEGDKGEEGLGTQSGGIEGGSKAEPNETNRPQPRPAG